MENDDTGGLTEEQVNERLDADTAVAYADWYIDDGDLAPTRIAVLEQVGRRVVLTHEIAKGLEEQLRPVERALRLVPPATTPLRDAIRDALNRHSAENGSHTPDFILAGYLTDCLAAFDRATALRTSWYSPEDAVEVQDDPPTGPRG